MGSAEGFALADQAIAQAAKNGTWVLLKNVHLASSWLSQLEKRLLTVSPHPQFRLFLTMEINPKVPVNLLRHSRVLMFEPPPGIKANLVESLSSIPSARANHGQPAERTRLYFLLAWLHAVIIERLRYSPLGWTKVYEFNDSDFMCALSTVDGWLDNAAKGKSNLNPEAIPWDAIKALLKESVYGGRLDNEFDRYVLGSFVDRIFSPAAYNIDFALVENLGNNDGDIHSDVVTSDSKLLIPEGTSFKQFLDWSHKLPDREPPTWLGLPPNAENLLLVQKGEIMIKKILQLKALDDDVDEMAYDPTNTALSSGIPSGETKSSEKPELPAYMQQVQGMCTAWLNVLPTDLPECKALEAAQAVDPISRVFEREYSIAKRLLSTVRDDLEQISRVCCGEQKQTNHLRSLLSDFNAGTIPHSWIETYTVPSDFTISKWIVDFGDRLNQLKKVLEDDETPIKQVLRSNVWLGGLVFPEALHHSYPPRSRKKPKLIPRRA